MEYKFLFHSDIEKTNLFNQNKDKYLKREENINSGNYLIFTDVKPLEIEVVELKQRLMETEQALASLLLK